MGNTLLWIILIVIILWLIYQYKSDKEYMHKCLGSCDANKCPGAQDGLTCNGVGDISYPCCDGSNCGCTVCEDPTSCDTSSTDCI